MRNIKNNDMEGKRSFILYCDLINTVEKLPDDKAGQLFKIILNYVNDNNPVIDDILLDVTFEPIKQQFKRDLESWNKTKEGRSKAGKASAEKRRLMKLQEQQDSTNSTNVNFVQQDSTNSTVNVNDTVNDNDIKIDWKALIGYFNQVTGKKSRTVDKKAKAQLLARLKDGYTKDDIGKAIRNCANDSYHKENNLKWLTLEFISRPNQFDKWLNTDPIEQPKKSGFAWD